MGDNDRARIVIEIPDDVAKAGIDKINARMADMGGKVVRMSETSRNALDRLSASVEKQAQLYGKTGIEKLVALRDMDIKKCGQNQQAVESLTKSYDQMIKKQKELDDAQHGFGNTVKQFIENPLGAAKDMMSGFGGACTAGIGAVVAFGVAAFESAKHLGELALTTQNVSLRTGLTIKEVGQFSFAAKATGQEVDIFETGMRKLSSALTDTSDEGKKARGALKALGVDARDVYTGELKPTSDILLQISRGLNGIASAPERNAALKEIFGKGGIVMAPTLLGLGENVGRAKQLGLGLDETSVKQWESYHRQMLEVELLWERLKRQMQTPLAATVSFVFKAANKILSWGEIMTLIPRVMLSQRLSATDVEMGETEGYGYGASMSRRNHSLVRGAVAENDRRVALARRPLGDSGALTLAQKEWESAAAKLQTGVMPSVNDFSEEQKARAKYQGLKDAEEATRKYKEALKELDSFEARANEKELGSLQKIYDDRDKLIKQLGQHEDAIKRVNAAADKMAGAEYGKLRLEFEAYAQKDHLKRIETNQGYLDDMRHRGFGEDVKGFQTDEKIADIEIGGERSMIEARAGRAGRLAELGGDKRAGIETGYAVRLGLAKQLYDLEIDRIRKEQDGYKAAEMVAKAEVDYKSQLFKAEEEHETKLLEMQHERTEKLKGSIENLLDAAFTKSKSFLSLLGNTIKAALFAPVKEGLADLLTGALSPLIYGKNGTGGIHGAIAGIFGKRGGGIQDVQLQGGAVPVVIQGIAGPGGASAPGGASYSHPLAFAAGLGSLVGGGGVRTIGREVIGGGSSTAGLSRNASGLWERASGYHSGPEWAGYNAGFGTPPFVGEGSAGSSGGAGSVGGWAGILGGLKGGLQGLGNIGRHAGMDPTDEDSPDQAGYGGVKGGLMLAGGTALLMDGLRRGGKLGVAESTAGGAAIGMKFGGPIGAAVGAAVGFGLGMTRAVGLWSTKVEQARDQIKSTYGVDVPANSGLMKQILQLIDSQYGGSISTGIRSPQVRELIQYYSEGTGQGNMLNMSTPHAAGLSSSGGALRQESFYQNGSAYVFSSSIPSAQAGAQTVPSSGNPSAVQFSFNGPDLNNLFTGRVVSALVPGLVRT